MSTERGKPLGEGTVEHVCWLRFPLDEIVHQVKVFVEIGLA